MKYTDGMFAFPTVFIFLTQRVSQESRDAALNKGQ